MQLVNPTLDQLIKQYFLLFCTELTEVEEHADKDDEAEPGVEIRHKVNDSNDDVGNSWQHGEHNIAVETIQN